MKIFRSILLLAIGLLVCFGSPAIAKENENHNKNKSIVGTYRLIDWTVYQNGVEILKRDSSNFYPNGDQGWLYISETQILVDAVPYVDPFFAHGYIENYIETSRDGDRWLIMSEPNLPNTPFRFDARFVKDGKELIVHYDYTFLFSSTISSRNTLKWIRVSKECLPVSAPNGTMP